MDFIENYEIINILYKILIYIVLPILASLSLVSFFSGLLQSVVTINDEAISYSLKVITLTILLYYLYPSHQEILMELVKVCLK